MSLELLTHIRFCQAKAAIRQLGGQFPTDDDLIAAADLLAADPQWTGVEVRGALAEILVGRTRALRDASLGLANMAIAANAARCAAYLSA